MLSLNRDFSHIYVEKEVRDSKISLEVINRFPNASVIEIENYKEIFNRRKQDWRIQKSSSKLILARKKDDFLYNGSKFTPDFDHSNFFYNTLMMNCLYDCHYCYLQGMYPSANIVVFTNLEDYYASTEEYLNKLGSLYLSISYDTDLLAFENIVPYTKHWIEFTRERKNLTIEIRTKSANYNSIKSVKPCDNVILAWTMSPQSIIEKYETKTPSLKARLKSAAAAIADGWKVRLCFDPILKVANWEETYKNLFDEVASALPLEKVSDISLGTFRMNNDFYKNIRSARLDSDLIHFPYTLKEKTIGYTENEKSELLEYSKNILSKAFPSERIFLM